MSSTTNSTTDAVPIDAGQANLELAEALRDVAQWLELHAGDLPKFTASLYHSEYGDDARDVLTAVARALGDRAQEGVDSMGYVTISGEFGPVTLKAYASPRYLGGVEAPRPAPDYEPILPTKPNDEAWDERR